MVKIRCKKHPRYTATQPPRASCAGCIELYELRWNVEAVEVVKPKEG